MQGRKSARRSWATCRIIYDFAIAKADEALRAARSSGSNFAEALRALAGERRGGANRNGNFSEAADARDFFSIRCFAFYFGAPTRLGALPRGQPGALSAAILADSNEHETERTENRLDFFVGTSAPITRRSSVRVSWIFFAARLPG